MEQESTYKNIAVIGLGAAGGLVSVLLSKNPYNRVVGFDTKEPFSTLLPTGGGRCNLTYNEEDIREFAKNYPRGEKFLLSVFSRFNQQKTRKLFEDLGIKTYVQKDDRVFPVSDSSQKTVKILNSHLDNPNFSLKKEKVINIVKTENGFEVKTPNESYFFDYVIVATGGSKNSFELAEKLNHKIIEPKPSLCALDIKEKYLYKLSGVNFKDIQIKSVFNNKKFTTVYGDILFAHKFITGPAVFKVSALTAYENFDEKSPLELYLKLTSYTKEDIEEELRNNQKKSVKNVFSKFAPLSFIEAISNFNNIDCEKQSAQLKKQEKHILTEAIINLKLNAQKRIKDSEIVTAGGVDLKEINPKTMESKIVKGLYFIGEILDVDGYTGGFNLQNCWSGAYICAQNFN